MSESRTEPNKSPPAGRLAKGALVAFLANLAAGTAAWAVIALSPGTRGLMAWVPAYALYFAMLPATALVPALAFASALILRNLRRARVPPESRRPAQAGKAFRRLEGAFNGIALAAGALLTAAILAFLAWFLIGTQRVSPRPAPPFLAEGAADRPLQRLAFSSDPHFGAETRNPEATNGILSAIDRGNYDGFFVLGDLSETGFPGTGLEEAAEALARYLPDTPVATLEGNHDYLIGGSARYRKIFKRPPYWRMDSGSVHIIALDLPWGTERFTREQRAFLERTLASVKREDFTVVVSHCFFWSSGYVDPGTGKPWYDQADTIAEVSPILAAGGVDLVISGHNHYMEYLEADGMAFAVIGAMGGAPDPIPTHVSPASRWFNQGTFGYLDLDLSATVPTLTFRDRTGEALYRAELAPSPR